MRWRIPVVLGVILMVLGGTSGCGYSGLSDFSLPGGPALGAHPLHVTVDLADADNLVAQSAVKVDDVTVGVVESISIRGWNPKVEVLLAQGTHLPANAVAAVRQTGLLGEKYLDLSAPSGVASVGSLTDGAVIAPSRTSHGVEVEQVLGALSLLLNGGGLDHIRTITVELRHALDGRAGDVRGLLSQLDSLAGGLARNRSAILGALDGLDRLSSRLAVGHTTIATAIDSIGPAVAVLANQRGQLRALLQATTHLATVGSGVVASTQRDLLANLTALRPILRRLNEAGDDVPRELGFLLSFPFPDAILSAIHGDYVNANIQIEATLAGLEKLISGTAGAH